MTPPVGNIPLAVQRHSRVWVFSLVLGLALPLGIAGFVGWTVTKTTREAQERVRQAFTPPSSSTPATRAPAARVRQSLSWQGTDGILIDGTRLIGRGREVQNGDIVRLIALDIATGALKWQTDPLGTYSDTYRGLLAIDRDALVYTTEKGEVRTFALADGKPRWRVQLDERAKEICVGSEREIVIATADAQLRFLSRTDGKQTKTEKAIKRRSFRARSCPKSAPTDTQTPFELLKETTDVPSALERKLDLDIDAIVDGPGGRVASGERPKGTRVTTLIALDADNGERWRTTASADPLGAEGAPRTVTVGDDTVCIVYYGSEYRLACFALGDGKRLWDDAAPSFFEGLYALGDTLVMTTHRHLEVRELRTGKIRWTLD